MCRRFNLWSSSADLVEFFDLQREPASWVPRYNIAPMQRILTIRERSNNTRYAELMQWGFVPAWANDPVIGFEMINIRAGVLVTRGTFRSAFRQRRCLIPATGFYLWQKLDETSRPWHIFPRDRQPIAFAGLWESWRESDRTTICTCSIITTEASRLTKSISDQVPVILPPNKWNTWLSQDQDSFSNLAKLLVPCPDHLLDKRVVSNYVDQLRNDSPRCIKPVQSELVQS